MCGHSLTPLASLISQKSTDMVVLGKLIDPSGISCQASSDLLANERNTNAHLQSGLSPSEVASRYERLDQWLQVIASTVKTSVLPSGRDLSTAFWPMQSLPSFMLPHSMAYGLNLMTNPARFSLAGSLALASDGENIKDILRYTDRREGDTGADFCHAMSQTLFWSHLVPTAPDTQRCHPLSIDDPLILTPSDTQQLRLYLAGNMPSYQSRVYQMDQQSLTTLAVPSFSGSGQVVLLDPHSMTSRCIHLQNSL